MAEVVIPPGFGNFVCQLQLTGRALPYSITIGYQQLSEFETAVQAANGMFVSLSTVASSVSGPFEGGQMGDQWTFTRVIAYQNNGGTLTRGDSSLTAVPGIVGVANGMIVSSAVRVTKRGDQVGRHYQGRMFVPYLRGEAEVDQRGIITPIQLSQLQQSWGAVLSRMEDQENPAVILHAPVAIGPTIPPTPITQLIVQQRVGTQRRRLR